MDIKWEVNDDFFPHLPTESILQVVDFIENHHAEIVEGAALGVDHVPEDLCRHDDDRGIAIDDVVAGEQPHLTLTMLSPEVSELLVGQRLDGSGVERSPTDSHRSIDPEFRNNRRSRAGRSGDDHRGPIIDVTRRFDLELVWNEWEAVEEVCHFRRMNRTARIVSSYST